MQSKGFTKGKDLAEDVVKKSGLVVNAFSSNEVAATLTPNRLGSLIRSANQGDMVSFLTLAEEMEEKDSHYGAVLQTRKLSVLNYPTFIVMDNDKKSQDIVFEIEKLIKSPLFEELKFSLLDALAKGYSVVEIIWQEESSKLVPSKYKYCDPRWFRYNYEIGALQLELGDDRFMDLARGKFIVHKSDLKSGDILRSGLARPISTLYMCKSYTLTDWMAYLNMFSMPMRLGVYGSSATEEDIKTLKTAVARIGTDFGAVISEATEIKILDVLKNGSTEAFDKLQNYLNAEISKRVLGQTMTSENGSSLSQAKVHENTQNQIILADARRLVATINEQLIKPFVELNYPEVKEIPLLQLDEKEEVDVTAFVNNVSGALNMGIEVSKTYFYEKTGFRPPENESDKISAVKQVIASKQDIASLDNFGNVNTLEVIATKTDEVSNKLESKGNKQDRLSTKGYDRFINSAIATVDSIAKKCKTPEELLEMLPSLLVSLDDELLTKEIATASFVGALEGDLDIQVKKLG